MNFLAIYLWGLGISGVFACMIFEFKSFRKYFINITKEAISKMEPEEQYMLNMISEDTLISYEIILSALLSWVGFIYSIALIILFFNDN